MTAPVVVCTWPSGRGDPRDEWAGALTLGRRVAEASGTELRWVVAGALDDTVVPLAGAHAVAGIDHLDDGTAGSEPLGDDRPDALVSALVAHAQARPASVWIVPQTFGSRLVAARLAARLGAAVVMNTTGVEAGTTAGDAPENEAGGLAVTTAAYGGDTRAVYQVAAGTTAVLGLLAGAVEAQPAATPTAPEVAGFPAEGTGTVERVRVVEPARSEGPRLEDAEVIVAGGRGLGSEDNLKLVAELADALGGMVGVSRPLVDVGWIDSSHQVGLTGKVTRPGLYVAAGISGATQHMVGCTAAKTIVAINTDPDAAIFHHARFGVVGDCLEVLPELVRAVRALEGGA